MKKLLFAVMALNAVHAMDGLKKTLDRVDSALHRNKQRKEIMVERYPDLKEPYEQMTRFQEEKRSLEGKSEKWERECRAVEEKLRDLSEQYEEMEKTLEKKTEEVKNIQEKYAVQTLERILKETKNKNIKETITKFRTNAKITKIQRDFIKKLLMNKANRVVSAFQKIQSLPERKDPEQINKAIKFEKGLSDFANRTLKRSLDAFKNEYDEGKRAKERAVIQLINTTDQKTRNLFKKWQTIAEKIKLMDEAKNVVSVFETLNNAIKSVADNAFLNAPKDHALTYKTLTQLFNNQQNSMKENFTRWRNISNLAKKDEQILNLKKEHALKTLATMIKETQNQNIRDAITEFRMEGMNTLLEKKNKELSEEKMEEFVKSE